MATIVERPVSAMRNNQTSPPISHRDSIEVIDVDAYEPQNAGSSGSTSSNEVEIVSMTTRPASRQRGSAPTQFHEIIDLVDDDDDDEVDTLSARALSGHGESFLRLRHFFRLLNSDSNRHIRC